MRAICIVLIAVFTCGVAIGDVIKRVDEPEPCRVYQRMADNKATIKISGEIESGAPGVVVEACLTKNGRALPGFGWKQLKIEGQSFTGEIPNVPVGGRYIVRIKVRDGVKTIAERYIPGILVGDLWIVAGQSNMEGAGKLTKTEEPCEYVNAFYFGDKWGMAKDPLCWFDEAVEPVHWSSADPIERAANLKDHRAFRDFGCGPAVRFGKEMYEATGIPVGLIVCPHGGTSMDQWSPKLKDKGGESLYGCMVRRINLAGGKVAGCIWYQGESDALDFEGKDYKEKTIDFIKNLRADTGQPELPFIYVQLGPYRAWGLSKDDHDGWNKVQQEQLELEKELPNLMFAAAVDGTLSDPIHLDSASQSRLGVRLAKLAQKMLFGKKIEVGPRPVKIEFVGPSRRFIRVSYDSVNGRLSPSRNVRGFVIAKDDNQIPIQSCVVESSGKSVLITLARPAPEGTTIRYGRGTYPVVNLIDDEDFPAPVFGPMGIE